VEKEVAKEDDWARAEAEVVRKFSSRVRTAMVGKAGRVPSLLLDVPVRKGAPLDTRESRMRESAGKQPIA